MEDKIYMKIDKSDLKNIIENEIRSVLSEQAMGINVDFYIFHVKEEYQNDKTTVSKVLPMDYIESIGGKWVYFKKYDACCYVFTRSRPKVLSALNTWELPNGVVLSQACKVKQILDITPDNFDKILRKVTSEA